MKVFLLILSFVVGCLITVVIRQENAARQMEGAEVAKTIKSEDVVVEVYGTTARGEKVTSYSMENRQGLKLQMIDYGATVVRFETPDRDGKLANIVLTCPDMAGFEACTMYFNGSVGRYCNRIANGRFSIKDQEYELAQNNGDHHLHGGVRGFDKLMWKGEPFSHNGSRGVVFSLMSPDGDEGYPGNLNVTATYTLTDNNELIVEFKATTDKATPVSLTNHNYWNLAGTGTILEHKLQLFADNYIPVDDSGIPTGELLAVKNTPFDFLDFQPIGNRFAELVGEPIGYDHCYEINGKPGDLRMAAKVHDPASGRTMEIKSTEPGIQFYTGKFLAGTVASGNYAQYSAFCLETQHFPDSPNQSKFPSSILNPNESYFHKTVHTFGVSN